MSCEKAISPLVRLRSERPEPTHLATRYLIAFVRTPGNSEKHSLAFRATPQAPSGNRHCKTAAAANRVTAQLLVGSEVGRHLRRDPASHRWFRPAPVLAPLVPPRLIQPKQPQILPKLSSGSANMTTPSAAATTRSQSPRAAQHKATPRPAPVPAPQPATTVQRGAAMGLNTGSPLLIGNPAAAQPGMFPAGPAQGTFLLNQYIPGLGHSPILIQGASGQTQSSLGQIQGVQLALWPPHATGLTLGPQTGPRPHGGTSRTAWHPDACHPTEPGAKAQHLSGTATHDVAPLVCHSPGTATDAATAAGHAAHADHAGPAHTGKWFNGTERRRFTITVADGTSQDGQAGQRPPLLKWGFGTNEHASQPGSARVSHIRAPTLVLEAMRNAGDMSNEVSSAKKGESRRPGGQHGGGDIDLLLY
ncbi:hypothetical protein MRX96_028611 [Rhipicephalus microplus]